jgi:hypothetical protein
MQIKAWCFLALFVAATAFEQVTRADDSFAPCWRNKSGTTYQSWNFASSNNPAIALAFNNPNGTPLITFSPGAFSKGWKPASFGTKSGIWDLGQNGSAAVVIPNFATSPSPWMYVQLQVTYFEDSLVYRPPVLSLAGATLVSYKFLTNEVAAPGMWKTLQSVWLAPSGPSAETILIQGDITKGLLIDQVVVDTRIALEDDGDLPTFRPCWRGQAGSTFQQWTFGVSNNPASIPAELITNAYGTPIGNLAPGIYSADYINYDPFLGCRQGIWDMGKVGALTLSVPNAPVALSKYAQVQVTQYRDGLYNQNASVIIPGATLLSQQQQTLETTTFGGLWVVEKSVWKLDSFSSGPAQVLITAGTNSTLLDRVVVETLAVNFACPGNQTLDADASKCSKSGVGWAMPFVDSCTVTSVVCRTNGVAVSNPSTFPVGTTPVICQATDLLGGTETCSFSVTVNDKEAPTIVCPADIITAKNPSLCGAVVTFSPSVQDACSGATAVCTPPSGSIFLPGSTTVSCVALDAAGNVSSPCAFQVRVIDFSGDLAEFAPCWRGKPGATFQQWAFSGSGDRASLAAERVTNGFGISNAVIELGPFSYGYIDSDAFLGCRQGIWDLGMLGSATFTISNGTSVRASSHEYVQVQVTQYRDGVYNENASISIPGAVLVSAEERIVETTAFGGHWTVAKTLWRLDPPNPGAEKVVITAGVASALIDQVVVETETFDFACPGNLAFNVDPGQCSRAAVDWVLPPIDGCSAGDIVCRTNGVVVTTPGTFPVGTTPVVCAITDGQGGTFNCGFTVNVTDNEAPVAQCKNVTIDLGGDGKASITAADLNDGSSDNCGIASFVVSPNQFTCANLGPNTVTFTVLDVNGNRSSRSATVTVRDLVPPVMAGCPSNAAYQCIALVPQPAVVTALDNCDGNVPVVFREVQSNQGSSCNNTITRTWTATDTHGNVTSCSQTILVNDSTPPVMAGIPSDVTAECNSVPAPASVSATDGCGSAPSVTFNEVSTQDPDSAHIGHYNYTILRTWTATDVCHNTATSSQTITVKDKTKPVLTGQGTDVTIECPATPVFTPPSVADNCDPGPLITFSDTTTPGACAGSYRITRTWTAVDKAGNVSLPVTQSITVRDNTAPALVGVPADATVDCAGVPMPAVVTATDGCDSNPSVTLAETSTRDPNPAHSAHYNYSITRTWTAMDACHNSASAAQVIMVVDATAPVITGRPGNLTVSCPSEVPVPDDAAVVASDNCSGPVVVTHDSDVISGIVCLNHYTITRTYRAADASGNTSSASQTIVVNDTTKPVVLAGAIASRYASLLDAEGAALAATTATDNCSGTPVKTVATTGDPCNVTITVTATDACGNFASVVYHTRIDDQAPVISGIIATRAGVDVKNCSAAILEGVVNISVQASDNCNLMDGHPGILLSKGPDTAVATFVDENPAGTFNYTWAVTPAAGNGTWTAIVTASDLVQTTTSTFTLCVNQAQVVGSVQSEGFIGGNRMVTFVATGGTATKTWNLNLAFIGDTANYVLTDIPAGTQAVSAKTAWSLRETMPVTLDANGHAIANFISDGAPGWSDATDHYLRGGDLTGNNLINFQDYSVLGNNFYTYEPLADITGDGQVDYDDYFILFLNWMTEGDPE